MPTELSWYADIAEQVRAATGPDAHGALMVLFLDDDEVALAMQLDDGADRAEDPLLPNLALVLDQVGADSVLLVIRRGRGLLTRDDRLLWTRLQELMAGSRVRLRDLVAVGDRDWQAVRAAA